MPDELQPGSPAPDFTLADQNGNKVRLSDYRGNCPVVLFFYPKDDSPGCTKEACKFRDEFENFRKSGAVILGVSDDSTASHLHFAGKYKLPYLLLSDPGGTARKLYGVKKSFGIIPGRVTFVIDRAGRIRSVFSSQTEFERHAQEALKALGT